MIRSRGIGLFVLAALVSSSPRPASGQAPGGSPSPKRAQTSASKAPGSGGFTLATEPQSAYISLSGTTVLTGRTPIEVPPTINGRYKIVLLQGAGFSRSQGALYIPPRGGIPSVTSEPRGASPGLILRGFNYPGVPDISSGHTARGVAFAVAGTGGLVMAGASHFTYRKRLDNAGSLALDRALEARRFRDAWAVYGGAVLGASAFDYWTRSRIGLMEATATRVTLDAPKVSRGGAIWRSLFLPGAGQEFGNHRARGTAWLGAVLLTGAGIVVADNHVQSDGTDLKWAKIDLSNATPSEQAQMQLLVDEARRNLQVSDDIRRGFVKATIALYTLNLLDAMVMPLTVPAATAPKSSSITPIFGPGEAGMAVTLRF